MSDFRRDRRPSCAPLIKKGSRKAAFFRALPAQRGFYRSATALHRCSLHRVGASQRGHSLSQKRMAPLEPQEKDFDWQSQARMAFVPPEGDCLRAALPRLELLYDLPLLLSSAVAQPLAALLPYGCGTPLAGAALESERKCSVITCYRWHNIAASAAKPPR